MVPCNTACGGGEGVFHTGNMRLRTIENVLVFSGQGAQCPSVSRSLHLGMVGNAATFPRIEAIMVESGGGRGTYHLKVATL